MCTQGPWTRRLLKECAETLDKPLEMFFKLSNEDSVALKWRRTNRVMIIKLELSSAAWSFHMRKPIELLEKVHWT